MKLPDTCTVPDFILELVRVAPEEWTQAFSKETAQARLKDINSSLQNPDVLFIVACLAKSLLEQPANIENARLLGIQDVFTREQLIGEARGLRRFFIELQEIRTNLINAALDVPQ